MDVHVNIFSTHSQLLIGFFLRSCCCSTSVLFVGGMLGLILSVSSYMRLTFLYKQKVELRCDIILIMSVRRQRAL